MGKAIVSKNAKTADAKVEIPKIPEISKEPINLGALLTKQATFQGFKIWMIGDTPLITHAWSHKAKAEMLAKQTGALKPAKEKRDPQADFIASLYEMGDGAYGFPAMGIKNAILASAHKDKGIARSAVMGALWIDGHMTRVRPALAGAICDMPLLRIHGGEPEMREDMVKIGAGLNKTANLAYRGQFTVWAMSITGRFNPAVMSGEALAYLITDAGMASGLGEWRNERRGMFGAFHLATLEEQNAWDKFVAGKGALPVPDWYQPRAQAAE